MLSRAYNPKKEEGKIDKMGYIHATGYSSALKKKSVIWDNWMNREGISEMK